MTAALAFPVVDPVAFHVFGWPVHFYGLAYLLGMVAGWRYGVWLARRPPTDIHPSNAQDFVLWLPVALVLGARFGHILFYQPDRLLTEPFALFRLAAGGMSFHGGMLGIAIAAWLFCRRRHLPFFQLADVIVSVAPIGLFLGRLANFLNGELYGRPSQLPWAMVFPKADLLPRHPSQLYEALGEGLFLLILFWLLETRTRWRRRTGLFSGLFLLSYGAIRYLCEEFRAPIEVFMDGPLTMGQALSLPMIGIGGVLVISRWRRRCE